VSPAEATGPVIVTDGNTRQALALVRALGRRSIPVEVLTSARGSLAGASRFAASEHRLPDVESEPAAWTLAVEELLRVKPHALLVPTTEPAMGNLYRSGIDRCGRLAVPPAAAFEAAVDKANLIGIAREVGLDVPRSALVEDTARPMELPGDLAFPVIVKARRSRFLQDGRWQRGVVRLVRSSHELRRLSGSPGFGCGALIQEFVPGWGEGLFLAAARGRPLARFAHRRIREKPPAGGVAVLCESIDPDEELARAGERLLERLGWHGVAMLEFRRTPEGRAVLMELNPRLWGSLQLAIDAGLDFPRLLLALHGDAPLPELGFRPGVRSRWLLGDVDHLLIQLRARSGEYTGSPASRRGSLAAFLTEFFSGAKLDVLRWNDPGPFWRELRDWIRGGARSL
jgi:predicted ATP-grasp superfamily ATP-dependent carboligase